MFRRFAAYFGTKDFYRKTARVAIPFGLQNMLLSGQAMIDTIMVTRIGMVSSVGTAAQVDVLSGMIAYGCIGGVGMFAAQFFGAGDKRSLRKCTGLSLTLALLNAFLWFLLVSFCGKEFLSFYSSDPSVITHGYDYLSVSRFSLLLAAMNYGISNMFRNTQQAKVALFSSLIGSVVNVFFNAVFIFGYFGFPAMGVRGAAFGTILSQCTTMIILWGYAFYSRQAFIGSLREMFGYSRSFVKPIFAKVWPLIVNESIFGFGQTLFVKAFGGLGKEAMDAYYVANQIFRLLTFVIWGYGSGVQVLLGARLGEGEIEQAKKEFRYYLGLSAVLSLILATTLIVCGDGLVSLFQLQDPAVAAMAAVIVKVLALKAAMRLFDFVIFCILRAGGDAQIIQFLDAGLLWMIGVPLAFLAARYFTNIALVLLITQIEQLIRLVLAYRRARKFYWAVDLTKTV